MRQTKSQAGFSLVELMVVIAIIAVLSTVAVPKLQVFRQKGMQSEAITMLGGIFTATQAYYTQNSDTIFDSGGSEQKGNTTDSNNWAVAMGINITDQQKYCYVLNSDKTNQKWAASAWNTNTDTCVNNIKKSWVVQNTLDQWRNNGKSTLCSIWNGIDGKATCPTTLQGQSPAPSGTGHITVAPVTGLDDI